MPPLNTEISEIVPHSYNLIKYQQTHAALPYTVKLKPFVKRNMHKTFITGKEQTELMTMENCSSKCSTKTCQVTTLNDTENLST